MRKFASIFLLVAFLVPMAFGQVGTAVKVDETKADHMHYYDNANQYIYVNPADGKVHFTYNYSTYNTDSSDFADHVMARYQNVTDGVKTDVRARAGNGNLGMGSDGRLLLSVADGVIAWDYFGGWGQGIYLYQETSAGSGTFDSLNVFSPDLGHNNAKELLEARFVVDPDGVIHWIAYDGWGRGWTYINSDDGGVTFNEPVFMGWYNPAGYQSMKVPVYSDPFGGSIAAGTDGKVAIVCQDQGRDVYVAFSDDYGATWPDNTPGVGDSTLTYNITNNFELPTAGGDSMNARPNQFNAAIFDKHNNLHVVWEATFWLDSANVAGNRNPYPGQGTAPGTDSLLFFGGQWRERLMHWSEGGGTDIVAYSTAVHGAPLGYEYRSLTARSRASNIHAPTLAYDASTDMLYCGWTQGDETMSMMNADGLYLGYTDLYAASFNVETGVWSPAINVTNTPTMDERYLVFNKEVVNGKIHAFYVKDDKPGINWFWWPNAMADVMYHTIDVSEFGMSKTPGQKVATTTAEWMGYYDNYNQFIYVDPSNGKVHLTYNYSEQSPDSADWGDKTWGRYHNLTDGVITDVRARAGNGNIGMGSDGRLLLALTDPVIAWGYIGAWGDGCFLYQETAVGSGTFDSLNVFSPDLGHNNAKELLSSRFVVDPDGVIHWIAYDGWGRGWTYINSDDGGVTFNEPVFMGWYNPAGYQSMKVPVYHDPFGGRVAAGKDGKVAIVCQDQGRDVYVAESDDYGATWPDNTPGVGDSTLTFDITGNGPLPAANGDWENARPNQFNAALYDKDNNLHVVFEATFWTDSANVANNRNPYPGTGQEDGALYYGGDMRERLIHWSPNTGLQVAAYSTAVHSDQLGWEYRSLTGRSRATNIHRPTMAYDEANDMFYIGWTQGDEYMAEWNGSSYVGWTELMAVAYDNTNNTFSDPLNITNTANFDERVMVFNPQVVDGKIHMFYIGDMYPGINAFYNSMPADVYYHTVSTDAFVTAIGHESELVAADYKLMQNYPNPFNPTTTIEYMLPKASNVKLAVFNMLGQRVKTLVNGMTPNGSHKIEWNATNEAGRKVASGVYFYRLETDFGVKSRKMVLLK